MSVDRLDEKAEGFEFCLQIAGIQHLADAAVELNFVGIHYSD